MLKNYLLLAVKNFRKQKMFSLINVLGLTVGITCCLMIFLFITNEFSYDKFHKNGNNIYRIMRVGNIDGVVKNIPWVSPMYGPTLASDYPDMVQKTTRVSPDNDLVTYNNISFNEKKIYLVDSNFFQFFSFKLLKGNPAGVLSEPGSIVMTASAAKKYFGNDDPIGKTVELNKKLRLKVTGIAEDVPVNSHLEFDMVVPIANWKNEGWMNQWPGNNLFVYLQLNPAVKPEQLISRFPAFMDKYLGKFYRENGFKMDLTMHPLKDIYFEGESPWDNVKHGSKKMVYVFMSIAALILIIACINFMNLATARATDRSKEVGLRKVMGAVRRQLALQFIFESLLFATLASVLALVLLQLIMPAYTNFLGYKLPSYWNDPRVYLFLLGVIVVVGLLAGSYPALLMSSFSPIESLKGKLRTGKGGAFFRKTLVVFQFGISVLLIISVTIVMKQMHYLRTSDMGFDKEQSMIVRLDNHDIWEKKIQFKNQLQADPSVANVSVMTGEPGGFHDSYGFDVQGKPGERMMFNTEFADFEYVPTLGLRIIAGRNFSSQFPTDSTNAAIINRAAAIKMGYTPEQAIGKWIKNLSQDSLPRTIVGVVEDYHFASLKQVIGPLVISTKKDDRRLVVIKLKLTNLPQAIDRIRKIYTSEVPDYPFEYTFLDERFNKLYKSEASQETLLSVFSIIAICIACLGLFGLASYTAIKRTKEIGVRKVLGSSVENIVLLLSKDLLKPVLLGTLIAVPLGYFVMQKWLQSFAYKVDIHWWMFAIAAMIAVMIALFTVSVQAVKAALANPVKSLRTE
ncbi:ABC transporter permease [Danxiaibacter flavus]|uniref:ABC transporter permease n=1 Tax=Danxiaibacter flavus TaxID=3049108 RepID=A0ABV3Z9I2_9BACT|nr:ABC transporter permease [Chitinophagaceae bacterium DXS]